MRRQAATEAATAKGSGTQFVLDPAALPLRFEQRLAPTFSGCPLPADISLDKDSAVIKRRIAGVPLTVCVPINKFDGIMVRIVPAGETGAVIATLILKHPDSALSITLAETRDPNCLASIWTAWAKALDLQMLVCDLGGDVKPIDAYSAKPAAEPAPRRKLAQLTGRRPRFLTKRRVPAATAVLANHGREREIIARN